MGGNGSGVRLERVRRTEGCEGWRLYALKTVFIDEREDDGLEAAQEVLLQATLLSHAHHRHIVKVVEAYLLTMSKILGWFQLSWSTQRSVLTHA